MSAAVVVKLAEARAILGGERDRLRAVWDDRAGVKDRRLLLAMAGCTVAQAGLYARLSWCDLRPEVRADVAGGLRRFRAWAEALTA